MPTVELNDAEWQQILNLLGDVPWKIAHPLLMRIGGQLNAQSRPPLNQTAPPGGGVQMEGIRLDANGKEVRNE